MILEQFKVESETTPGKYYVVSKTEHVDLSKDPPIVATWECSCLGWTRHMPRRDCKHIQYHKAFGGRPLDPMLMAMMKIQRREDKKAAGLTRKQTDAKVA